MGRTPQKIGERVVLSINDFLFLFAAMVCTLFSDRSRHVLLAEKRKECSKCMLRIERRSIGSEGRSSSGSTDHEI